jgi:hypothetical protein
MPIRSVRVSTIALKQDPVLTAVQVTRRDVLTITNRADSEGRRILRALPGGVIKEESGGVKV